MGNKFILYLFYIIVFIVLLTCVFIWAISKRSKKNSNRGRQSINCGNVSVLFDRSGNVIMIPFVKDKYGRGKATGDLQFLKTPYDSKKLGKALRCCMNSCKTGVSCSDADLMARLNSGGWKEFSEDRKNVSVHYQQAYGIVFNSTSRNIDGSYQFNHAGFEETIVETAGDELLGNTLLKQLHRCRC